MSSYTLHIQYVDRPAETRTFTQAKVTLGRDSGDIVLHDTQVSGRHGEITFDSGTLRYTDVGSTNGSFLLQGQRVANIELTPGIALRLGNSLITVQVIDAPNVAGKGRTVIAGPGMAPGFPAPMRHGGAPAPPAGPAAAGFSGIPRPGMPFPAPAPPSPPPGGFAHAATAQMQSPGMPPGMPAGPAMPGMSGVPGMPVMAPASGAFVPQPTTMPAPVPGAPLGGPAPMTPVPMPAPNPITQPPTPTTQPPQPVQSFAPPPMAPPSMAPFGAAPGGHAGVPQAPMAVPPVPVDAVAVSAPSALGVRPDLVNAVKAALLGGWSVAAPTATVTVGAFIALMVPVSVFIWLLARLLPPGVAFGLGSLLGLAQVAAMLILIPSAYRFVLAAHLGQPITPQAAVAEVRAKLGDVLVNMLVPGIVLGVFAGPVYWLEGKKVGDAIGRNFNLIGKDVATIVLTWVALVVPIVVVTIVLGVVFGLMGSLGLLLTLLVSDVLNAVMIAYTLGLSTWFYFDIRRRFETADPEGEARARLGAPELPGA